MTASRAAAVRLKKVGGSGLGCVVTGRTFFSFWPSETSREPKVLLEELIKYTSSAQITILMR